MSPTTFSPTAQYLRQAIDASDKTQREIARDAGFAHPNVLSMMKSGECKVPISRIPALAAALGTEANTFIEIALREYNPEIWFTLTEVYTPLLSETERRILETYRNAGFTGHAIWNEELDGVLHALFTLAGSLLEPAD